MLSTTLPVAAGGNYTAQSPYSSSADATRLQLANSSGLELTVHSGTTTTTIPPWAAAVVRLTSASVTVLTSASGPSGTVELFWLVPADPLPIPNGPLSGATEITVTGTVDLAAGAEVTIDTAAGPVDVNATGTVDIGNTPAVTIDTAGGPVDVNATGTVTVSSITNDVTVTPSGTVNVQGVAGGTTVGITGTVDIGNTPAVTVDTAGGAVAVAATGTIDINSVAGNVDVANGSVQLAATDAALLVGPVDQAIDIAPGANVAPILSGGPGGSVYVDELLILVSSPNKDLANLGLGVMYAYVADPAGKVGFIGELSETSPAAPTEYDASEYYDAVYVVPLSKPTWVGQGVVLTLVNNNPSGGATINETLTITVYGKLTTQAVANASDTTLDVVQPVATNGQYAGLATTSTSDGDYVTVPQSTGALVLAASVRYSMSGSGTVEMEVVDDSSGDVLDHFTEVGPCTGGFSIDIPPGGFQLTGAIKLEQISNTGTPTGDVYVTAKWA
jgi:hypothetical protein